ncbi:MAG: hypothetical protein ACE5FE_07140 [Acidiferrobacterales bacterium]
MIRQITTVAILVLGLTLGTLAAAKEIMPMYGGVLIEGYEFGKDTGPKGTLSYNPETNEFRGTYRGLKMPPGRRAIFAWLHDTVNQKSIYLGVVGGLEPGGRGRFTIEVPGQFKDGNFGSYEIVGFTSEETGFLNGAAVVTQPKEPSRTKSVPKPAFYLFSALPGADTDRHWCGHGQDFFYAKDPTKQTCYDCKCGVKYSICILAGLNQH